MARNISFSHTTVQVRNRTKTVTRRLGWYGLKPGTILNACEKCQGLKKGEKVKVICQVRVISAQRQRLADIDQADVDREGFPDWTPAQFIGFFCKAFRCGLDGLVNRIEFEYLGVDDNDL